MIISVCRGSKIRFMILPDMLKNAPMFKNMMTRFDTNLENFCMVP